MAYKTAHSSQEKTAMRDAPSHMPPVGGGGTLSGEVTTSALLISGCCEAIP